MDCVTNRSRILKYLIVIASWWSFVSEEVNLIITALSHVLQAESLVPACRKTIDGDLSTLGKLKAQVTKFLFKLDLEGIPYAMLLINWQTPAFPQSYNFCQQDIDWSVLSWIPQKFPSLREVKGQPCKKGQSWSAAGSLPLQACQGCLTVQEADFPCMLQAHSQKSSNHTWRAKKKGGQFFIAPESDHWPPLSLTDWLTN